MSDTAQKRIQAIGQHLDPAPSPSPSSQLPPIVKVAPNPSKLGVDGKVVIITGANSITGLGRATAHQYAESGARAVYLCDFDASHLEAHRREIGLLHPSVDVHARHFDASDETRVKAVIDDALQRYGRLDVFFANAGITGPLRPFTETTEEEFMKVARVNTLSVFLAAKHAAPAMKKTSPEKPIPGGSFIATASVAGLRANAGSAIYSASKAAVISFAQTLSYELAGTGVRVNAICPGLIETSMTAPLFEMARARGTSGKVGQLNPLRRAGHADEIARVALFLGSDESSYVNGQAWAVDGGLSSGHPHTLGRMK